MPSIIQAGNAASTGLVTTGATDGILELRSGTAAGGTVAMTINAAGAVTAANGLAVTGSISSTTGANFATSSGNVGIGTTSANVVGRTGARFNVAAGSDDTVQLKGVSASFLNIASWIPATGTVYHIGFGDTTGSYTERGVITTNGTGTTYGTNSDYRLKEAITPMTDALNVVQQLKPVTYKWKADGSDGQGFIAHELQTVVPDAVVGEKDGLKEDGSPLYQNIDTSFLVATLTAAIQEQQALIESLTTRLTALEGSA